MLEECDLPYVVKPIDITGMNSFPPRSSPSIRMRRSRPSSMTRAPVNNLRIGGDPRLSRGEDRAFPSDGRGGALYATLQWLFQMGGVGPMFGQVHHFPALAQAPVPVCDRTFRQGSSGGSTACSTGDSVRRSFSLVMATIQLPTWPTYPWVARHK